MIRKTERLIRKVINKSSFKYKCIRRTTYWIFGFIPVYSSDVIVEQNGWER